MSQLTGPVVAYYLLAIFIIICAVMLLSMRKVMYMALAAGGVFVGIAGIYILMQADFLAFAQILIYAGAITILMVFAIMLTRPHGSESGPMAPRRYIPAAIGALGSLVVILYCIRSTTWVTARAMPHPDNTVDLGMAIFKSYTLPFELVSIVLIAALVGTVSIARKEDD